MILNSNIVDLISVEPHQKFDRVFENLSNSFWIFSNFFGIFILVSVYCGCSPEFEKEHVFEMAVCKKSNGIDERVVVTVLERGRYVLAVDGKMWRSDFVNAKYSIQRNGNVVPLPFLTVHNPVQLWDSFVRVNDTWFCIDISGYPYRDKETQVNIIQFKESEILRRIEFPWNEMECRVRSVSILNDGTGIILDNDFEGKFFLDLGRENSNLVIIDESDYFRELDHSESLNNDGIFLNMGVHGTFGKWCQ